MQAHAALFGVKLPKAAWKIHLLLNNDLLSPQFVAGLSTDKAAIKRLKPLPT